MLTFDDLVSFIHSASEVANDPQVYGHISWKPYVVKPPADGMKSHSVSLAVNAEWSGSKCGTNCQECSEPHHDIDKCTKLLSLSIEQRCKYVKENYMICTT